MLRFARLLARRYLNHHVGTQAAALAFYLLFMIFPFLIFLSALLGLLEVDVEAILLALEGVVPQAAVEVIGMYLHHVRSHQSPSLAAFGLVFSIWFPTRASNSLLRAVRTAYHLGPPKGAISQGMKSLICTAVLMTTVTVTLTVLSVSDWLLGWAVETVHLPYFAAFLWERLRFPVAAAAGFFALSALYILAQDARTKWRHIWPGTVLALVGWLALSWGYNLYVENFANYSALYGSIGTIIVVLIWLDLSAVVLILGAEVNGILKHWNHREREEQR